MGKWGREFCFVGSWCGANSGVEGRMVGGAWLVGGDTKRESKGHSQWQTKNPTHHFLPKPTGGGCPTKLLPSLPFFFFFLSTLPFSHVILSIFPWGLFCFIFILFSCFFLIFKYPVLVYEQWRAEKRNYIYIFSFK